MRKEYNYKTGTKRAHKSTRIDVDIISQVEGMATEQHRSFSNMLEVILNEYFDNKKAA